MSARLGLCIGPGTPDGALRYLVDDMDDNVQPGVEYHGQIITRVDRQENTVDLMWPTDFRRWSARAERGRTPVL